LKRIFRAAGIAAAAVALIAAAGYSSPSLAFDLQGAPAPGYTGHEAAQIEESDLALNDAAPPPAAPAAPAPFAALFQHATAWLGGDAGTSEAKPAPGLGSALSLGQLVAAYAGESAPDGEQDCLANAVYFEARGEPIEGQLAVAQVVMNRAASGRYPATLCGVVTQPAQFSFIRHGRFPQADKSSEAWRKAVAIAHIARARLVTELASDVLWYHAAYVSPGWGRRLNRQARIGLHIFYS